MAEPEITVGGFPTKFQFFRPNAKMIGIFFRTNLKKIPINFYHLYISLTYSTTKLGQHTIKNTGSINKMAARD